MHKDLCAKVEEIFLYFYKNATDDRYLSNFLRSSNQIDSLIKRQKRMLCRLIETVKDQEEFQKVLKEYEHVFLIHWKLRIEENFMFDFIDIIGKKLKNLFYARNFDFNLTLDDIEIITMALKNGNAKAYLQGTLDEIIFSWEKSKASFINKVYLEHIEFFQKLKNEEFDKILLTNVKECPIGKYLSSAEFLVKSYRQKKLVPYILHFHSSIHLLADFYISYYQKEDYLKALRIMKLISNYSHQFLHLAILVDKDYELHGERIIFDFVAEPMFSNNTLSFFFSSTANGELERELFIKFAYEMQKRINAIYPEKIASFVIEEQMRFYILLIEDELRNFYLQKIIETIRGYLEEQKRHFNRKTIEKIFKGVVFDVEYVLRNIEKRHFDLFIKNVQNRLACCGEFLTYLDAKNSLTDEILQETKEQSLFFEFFEHFEGLKVGLYAQPIYDLENEKIYSIEILARIFKGDTIIPAYKFIKFVTELGQADKFDRYILSTLLEKLKKTKKVDVRRIFINLFPSSYLNEEIIKLIYDLNEVAKEKGVEIVLEITEYESVGVESLAVFEELSNVQIAVDDFGTGYSNFDTLSKLIKESKVRYLKIDGMFVRGILEDDGYRMLLRSIIFTILSVDKIPVFEFIENKEIIEFIKSEYEKIGMGKECPTCLGQGFLFGQPKPLEEFIR